MNKLTVEYLIIFKQEDTFCNSEKSFLNFLEVDSSISIDRKKNIISLKNDDKGKEQVLNISYTIETSLVSQKEERYFKLLFTIPNKGDIKLFDIFIGTLDKIIKKLHEEISINVLWNDIARQYAIEGYGMINEVENLLRRLIANFMLINVGIDWVEYYIPSEVEDRDAKTKIKYTDYLHQTYFSDLKTILFRGMREPDFKDIGKVQHFIEKCISKNKTTILVDDLKGVISTSLWEKYFSKGTKYKKEQLEKDLEQLNELRNEIAHNRHITRVDLERIEAISKIIIKALELEIKDLPNKKLTKDEVENLNDDLASVAKDNQSALELAAKTSFTYSSVIDEFHQKMYGDTARWLKMKRNIEMMKKYRIYNYNVGLSESEEID